MNAALAPDELAPEDAGRLNLYALLARLLHAGPDEALLQALAGASDLRAGSDGFVRLPGDGPSFGMWRTERP